MKIFSIITSFIFLSLFVYAQDPQELTPQVLKRIDSEINAEATQLKRQLQSNPELSKISVEFAIYTFRVESKMAKSMEVDYSTAGMLSVMNDGMVEYDKLLNKYYKLLLNKLSADDKKELIAVQRAWIDYRDKELKLLGTLAKEEYSGGGTMQDLAYSSSYVAIVKNRTIELYNYYSGIITE